MMPGIRVLSAAAVVSFSLASAPVEAQSPAPPCPWPGPAQFLTERPSAPDSVLFTVGGEPGKLCYSRPVARGRRVFGNLVEFGKVWRTGANEPTMLFLPVATRVAGVQLPAGRYIIMTIPDAERWAVLFNTSVARTPVEMFNALTEVARAHVPAEATATHVEQLTFRAERDTAGPYLVLEWERTRVRVLLGDR